MILVTTASAFDGYRVIATKGTAQGTTFEDMLCHADALGANAILNARYDNALGAQALFHGTAVLTEPLPGSLRQPGGELDDKKEDSIHNPAATNPCGEN
jgi:uncharacterized protein YbjQ (UPF0145 family)